MDWDCVVGLIAQANGPIMHTPSPRPQASMVMSSDIVIPAEDWQLLSRTLLETFTSRFAIELADSVAG